MSEPAIVGVESGGTVIIHQRLRSNRRRFCAIVISGMLAASVIVISTLVYRKQRALDALHASGFVMCRMLPGPEWLHQSVDSQWRSRLEHSGWLCGTHIVGRVGPPPRRVTWEALEALVQLQQAERLWLHDCGLTDEQLALVAQVQVIKVLDIEGNPITDEGLEHLTSLSSLEFLNVIDTDVTTDGVERFRKSMPQCRVADGVGGGKKR